MAYQVRRQKTVAFFTGLAAVALLLGGGGHLSLTTFYASGCWTPFSSRARSSQNSRGLRRCGAHGRGTGRCNVGRSVGTVPIDITPYGETLFRDQRRLAGVVNADALCEYAGPLQQTLAALVGANKDARILNIGCSTDPLSEMVYADGFTNLVSLDSDESAIKQMVEKTSSTMPLAKWSVDDPIATRMEGQSVDIILDKGYLDSVLRRPSPYTDAASLLKEVQRVLKVGGSYLLVTHGHGDPDVARLPLLALPHLSLNVQKTPDLGGYYLFVCTKVNELPANELEMKWQDAKAWASERDQADMIVRNNAMEDMGQ